MKDFINNYKVLTRMIVLGVFILWVLAGWKFINVSPTDTQARVFDIISSTLLWIMVLYLIRRALENPDVVSKLIDKLPGKK